MPIEHVATLAAYARDRRLPFHMHVAEQRRELDECRSEHGTTPVELLARHGILDERFVAIHATHLSAPEIAALGAARACIGLCRTTERDLGDGAPETAARPRAPATRRLASTRHGSRIASGSTPRTPRSPAPTTTCWPTR
jgi:cytosine/adenosine deaminase-related metal-dependent hydrolase